MNNDKRVVRSRLAGNDRSTHRSPPTYPLGSAQLSAADCWCAVHECAQTKKIFLKDEMKKIGKKQKTEVLRGPMRFPSARHHVVTGPRVGPSPLTGHIHVWAGCFARRRLHE
jgi:hypothetical protein